MSYFAVPMVFSPNSKLTTHNPQFIQYGPGFSFV